MKKIALFAAAGLMTLAACQENASSYTINGTVADAADGEYVYLRSYKGRGFETLDSAVVKGGKFQLVGTPDSIPTPKMVIYSAKGSNCSTMIFLEQGQIDVNLAKENSSVAGTANNVALHTFMTEYRRQNKEMNDVYMGMRKNKELTDAQRDSIGQILNQKNDELEAYVANQTKANVTNAFGAYLLTSMGSGMNVEELSKLLPQVQEPFASTEAMLHLKSYVENSLKTVVGKKYIDFSMNDPEGKTIKLSDFVGKNKYVLIDFWASWCGPCRNEMPNVVAAYKQFKNKGFEIVGVSLDQNADKWKGAIKDLNMTWNHMSDLKGWQCAGAGLYGVRGIPATVLVDQEGTIVARNLRGEELLNKLSELLK